MDTDSVLPVELIILIFERIDLGTYGAAIRCCKWVNKFLAKNIDKFIRKDVFLTDEGIYVYSLVGLIRHGPYILYNNGIIVKTGTYYYDKLHGEQLKYNCGELITRHIYEHNFVKEYESYIYDICRSVFKSRKNDNDNDIGRDYIWELYDCTINNMTISQKFLDSVRHGNCVYTVDNVDILTVIYNNNFIVGAKYYDTPVDFNTISEFGFNIGGNLVKYSVSNGQCHGDFLTESRSYKHTGTYVNGRRHGLFICIENGVATEYMYNNGTRVYSKDINSSRTEIRDSYCSYITTRDSIKARYYLDYIEIILRNSVVVRESIYKMNGNIKILIRDICYDNGCIKSVKELDGYKYILYAAKNNKLVQNGYQYLNSVNNDRLINGFYHHQYPNMYQKYCL